MGNWSYYEPTGTTNYILDPVCGLNTFGNGYWDLWDGAAWQAGWLSQVVGDKPWQGSAYYYRGTAGAGVNFELAQRSTMAVGAAEDVTMQVWIDTSACSGTPGNARMFSAGNDTTAAMVLIRTEGNWTLYGVTFLAMAADSYRPGFFVNGMLNTETLDWGGVQFEIRATRTSLCAGTLPGCEWNGADDHSTSTRSALSRAGGVITDFEDLYFDIGGMVGPGMSPVTLNLDPYAVLSGGELNSTKTESRTFTLTGMVRGTSLSNLHANREALIEAVAPNSVPEQQPIRIRYTGAALVKEIYAYYQTGWEGQITADFECVEQRIALRFVAADPNFYEVGSGAAALDTKDTPTMRYIAARLRSTGQWDDLGLTNNPTTGGADIWAILYASDGYVYVGGNFTGWDAVAGRDYVTRYDRQTGAWETVGGGGDFGGTVFALCEGPDGTIYAGGLFLNCAADANADYLAEWDGTNWSAVGPGPAGAGFVGGAVYSTIVDLDGNLVFGGTFDNWAGNVDSDCLALWDGAVYDNIGSPGLAQPADQVLALAVNSSNELYIGGNFNNLGGVATADELGYWDGTNYSDVGGVTPNGNVTALLFDDADLLYIGGAFTNLAGIAECDYIAAWTNVAYQALSTGTNAQVYALAIAPDGVLYAAGGFSRAGTITNLEGIARWNGSSWAHLDVSFSGVAVAEALMVAPSDPVIAGNYDVWIAPGTTGAGGTAGSADVTNDGTEDAYPLIKISRSGGVAATIKTIRNETLGLELLLDYGLLDGEELSIELQTGEKTVFSSFFGQRLDAILPDSDFGVWHLQPGANQVTVFVSTTATITATLEYQATYWSSD